jgi:hypothetical protein
MNRSFRFSQRCREREREDLIDFGDGENEMRVLSFGLQRGSRAEMEREDNVLRRSTKEEIL